MEISSIVGLVIAGIAGIIVLCAVLGSFFTTAQNTRRIVERFGQFKRVARPGLGWKVPFIDSVSDAISLRVQQFNLKETTYTSQNTSVTIEGSVQYQVGESDDEVKAAYYKLADPTGQIKSHVASAIGAKVPTMTLGAVQEHRSEIGAHVNTALKESMSAFGYIISDVPITAANPDDTVVKANNEKYASQQAKETAINLAEAKATQTIRNAQAEAEAMELRGKGIAGERAAIIAGLQTSIAEFEKGVAGATAQDAMNMVQFQNYCDTLKGLATGGQTKVIFVPIGGNAASALMEQLTQSLVAGNEAAATPAPAATTPAAG